MCERAKVFLTIFVLIVFSFCLPCIRGSSGYVDVTASEAKNMIDTNSLLAILDVRTQSEYDSGHIRNAKLIPHTELEARMNELDENGEILVYSNSGHISAIASQTLVEHGFEVIYNMFGGIIAWTSADYPVFVCHSSIQSIIDNATDGDTIFVASGIYYEQLTVSKALTLVGENKDTTVIDGGSTGMVVVVTVNNVSINDFMIRGSGCGCGGFGGLSLVNSHNSNIIGNIIRNNGYGIKLQNSIGCTISDNIVINNESGAFRLVSSHSSSVTGNVMKDNGFGIELLYSSGCMVDCNILANHTSDGIYLYNSDGCTVSNTEVTGNDGIGVWLYDSDNCTGAFNTIAHNMFGISLQDSDGNSIYHNNFINNTHQASLDMIGFNNSWDDGYPSGGNYWGDYDGTDEFSGQNQDEPGSDGIGDVPYVVGSNNQDRYPLMNPYILPEKLQVLYYELLEKYNNLSANYQSLNSTYYKLLHCYSDILVDFGTLDVSYNLLSSNYDNLTAIYNELKSKQEATTKELNNIRNLMYIFMTTTIILAATTVYFVKRKPKS